MKRFVLTSLFVFSFIASFSQTAFTAYKGGHEFDITVPSYMVRTTGLNHSAIIQFKNAAKDVYLLVIEDNKEELGLAEMHFGSLEEFQEYTMKHFLKDQDQRAISAPITKSVNGFKYIHAEASYYDKELKQSVYYLFGMVETKTSYYKLLCYTSLDKKEKFKADFEKTLYSIHD